jgi:hypothetical protein
LWIARQLCDVLRITTSPDGCTATLATWAR